MTDITLNVRQQEAVESINCSCLILAGPGTGKTTTLAARVKYMIERGVSPEKILCLTFSDAAANEMRKKFDVEIGRAAIGIDVFTYHGFCCFLIQEHADAFEIPENTGVVTESLSRAFVEQCVKEIEPKAYVTEKGDPYYYIDMILNQIGGIKSHRMTKVEYFENLRQNVEWEPRLNELKKELNDREKSGNAKTKTLQSALANLEKKIAKAKELWLFYELYQKKLLENRYMDFNDMISLVLDKFESDAAFLSNVANKYDCILVDEYQDTNACQNEIVFKLTEALNTHNVTVVGDDDQIIYSFQGARLDTIENFLKAFPKTRIICLTENHRSTQPILDLAYKVADQDKARLVNNNDFKAFRITKKLTAADKKNAKRTELVHCTKYADTAQEYTAIVDMIEQKIFDGVSPGEIAILTKTNDELEGFADLLKNRAVPYEMKYGRPVFSIPAVNVLYDYLKALVNPALHGNKLLKYLLSEPFCIDASDYTKLREEYSKYGNAITALRNLLHQKSLKDPDRLKNFLAVFNYLQEYRASETLKRTIRETLAKTGIGSFYLGTDTNRIDNIAGIAKLIGEAEDYATVHRTCRLEDFLDYMDKTLADGIEFLTEKPPVKRDAVKLMTYYSAKGCEYDIVFMPTLISDKWESVKTPSSSIPLPPDECSTAQEAEEKRAALKMSDAVKVMYVGLTRARYGLYLSFVNSVNGKLKKPTKFIADFLSDENVKFEAAEIQTVESFSADEQKLIEQRPYDYETDFRAVIDGYFSDHVFSISDVNAYRVCPRQYLYSKILGLGGEDGVPDALSFGSAMHKAMELAVLKAQKELAWCGEEEFIGYFKTELDRLPTSTFDNRKILEKRGRKALSAYYAMLAQTKPSALKSAELKIENDEGFPFIGFIDRIDENSDGTHAIYDYKTGNAKKAAEISANGEYVGYYTQMCVYKYVYEKTTGRKVGKTTFVFLEDPDKNVVLNLSDEDCLNAWNNLKATVDSMKAGRFEPSRDENACQYCSMRDFCQRNRI